MEKRGAVGKDRLFGGSPRKAGAKMETVDQILEQIREALERNDLAQAAQIIEGYRPADQAEVFAELEDEEQVALLPRLAPEASADILEELDNEQAAQLIDSLPRDTVARIVGEMEPDEAADVLGELSPSKVEALLSALEDPEEVRPLLIHPGESAGGLMTSDYMALRRRMTAQEAIDALRRWHPDSEAVYYLYVIDRDAHLCGVLNLRQLVVAKPNTLVMDIMSPDVISVRNDVDQEEVARVMGRYGLLALPVVDVAGKLEGVITVDDIIQVMEDEATEDMQKFGGAEPLERSYFDTSPLVMTQKRIGWLLLLFLTATLTGEVIRFFGDVLNAVGALVLFIPLLIGTGGNAGSQTTSTVIRALALGEVEPSEALRVWWHEARVGVLLGLGMAGVAYLRAITWEPDQGLALTVAIAAIGVILWATGVGALLPLLAARFRIDPAVVSGPVMSTLVDATGLLIYLWLATLILSY
jgi:magnesium transporter